MPAIRKDSITNVTTIEDGDYRCTVELTTQRSNGKVLWLWVVYVDGTRISSGPTYTHDQAIEACAKTVNSHDQSCHLRHGQSDYLGLLQHMALVL